MLNLSGFRNSINGDILEAGLQSAALNWSGRLTANCRFFQATSIQLTGFYSSPFVQPAGSFLMIGGVDIGIRQDLMKGRAQITANLTDVFNTKAFRIRNALSGYEFELFRKRESRILTINFTWRFGNGENAPQRRKQQSSSPMEEGSGGF
jgi:hypothetical protein